MYNIDQNVNDFLVALPTFMSIKRLRTTPNKTRESECERQTRTFAT